MRYFFLNCMSACLDVPTDLVLEPNYPGASQIQDKSPAGLSYWSPSLPVKIEFWAILWNLALPPKRSTLFRPSQFLCHFFAYFITNKSTVAHQKILMVYESCKTAPFSLAGLGFENWVDLSVRESGGGGGGEGGVLADFGMYCKRDSLQIFSLSNTK